MKTRKTYQNVTCLYQGIRNRSFTSLLMSDHIHANVSLAPCHPLFIVDSSWGHVFHLIGAHHRYAFFKAYLTLRSYPARLGSSIPYHVGLIGSKPWHTCVTIHYRVRPWDNVPIFKQYEIPKKL